MDKYIEPDSALEQLQAHYDKLVRKSFRLQTGCILP